MVRQVTGVNLELAQVMAVDLDVERVAAVNLDVERVVVVDVDAVEEERYPQPREQGIRTLPCPCLGIHVY